MTLEDFAKYFDLPIDVASKQLCLCATVIKKKIRSFKIPRWPYRKVKSIQRKISLLKESLGANCTAADHQTELELQMLQRQLDDILSGRLKP
ncbi:hypothetical protein BVRB_2g034090 [Beta vulgaris subsp. vulgaris]|nr:hypothetical protein BVRB_2g034090 [Beta vulgaris subsp. vulgaris]